MAYTDGDQGGVVTFVSRREFNYGEATYDRTHVFALNYLWDVPGSTPAQFRPQERPGRMADLRHHALPERRAVAALGQPEDRLLDCRRSLRGHHHQQLRHRHHGRRRRLARRHVRQPGSSQGPAHGQSILQHRRCSLRRRWPSRSRTWPAFCGCWRSATRR